MVHVLQSRLWRAEHGIPLHKTRHERPSVIIALDKHVHDFAVSVYTAQDDFAVLIFYCFRFHVAFAAALGGFFPRRGRVLHFQRDRFHTVAMLMNVIGNWML